MSSSGTESPRRPDIIGDLRTYLLNHQVNEEKINKLIQEEKLQKVSDLGKKIRYLNINLVVELLGVDLLVADEIKADAIEQAALAGRDFDTASPSSPHQQGLVSPRKELLRRDLPFSKPLGHGHGRWFTFEELVSEKDLPEEIELSSQNLDEANVNEIVSTLKHHRRLKVLCLKETGLTAQSIQPIVDLLMASPTLTGLDLGRNNLGTAGVLQVAKALETNTTLNWLALDDTNMTDSGAQAVQALFNAIAGNKTLTSLSLFKNNLGRNPMAVDAITEALFVNSGLQSLNLMFNNLGANGMKRLHTALLSGMNSHLTHLNLSYNTLGPDGAKSIAKVVKSNTTLRRLELWRNSIGDAGAQAIAIGLQANKTLQILDVRFNEIGAAGTYALSNALLPGRGTLQHLDLWNNDVGPKGAFYIANLLKTNVTLTSLNLRGTEIFHTGAIQLAEGLKVANGLLDLSLWRCKLGPEGIVPIAAALEVNKTLTSLNLNSNKIGKKIGFSRQLAGMRALAKAIKVNQSLVALWLDDNKIDRDGATLLADAVKENKCLAQLSLEKNELKEESPSMISIRQSLQRNIDSHIPGIKALLPFSIEVIEIIVGYAGVGQSRSLGAAQQPGTEEDYDLFEWEFRTKSIGEIEFGPPKDSNLTLDTSEIDSHKTSHARSRSMGPIIPSSSTIINSSLPSVSENLDHEPPPRFEPGSIVFHVDSYGNRGTRSLATSGVSSIRSSSLSSDSGRSVTPSSENGNSPASQKSPTNRFSGLLFGSSRDRSGPGSRRGSLGAGSTSPSSTSTTIS